jgi:hypothetical protein
VLFQIKRALQSQKPGSESEAWKQLGMISDNLVALSFDCNDHLPQLAALAKRYKDRTLDLAKLCLIRMSEVYPKRNVITVDTDE